MGVYKVSGTIKCSLEQACFVHQCHMPLTMCLIYMQKWKIALKHHSNESTLKPYDRMCQLLYIYIRKMNVSTKWKDLFINTTHNKWLAPQSVPTKSNNHGHVIFSQRWMPLWERSCVLIMRMDTAVKSTMCQIKGVPMYSKHRNFLI